MSQKFSIQPTLKDVEHFWNENPLFTGETARDENFFRQHTATYFDDVFFGIEPVKWFYFPDDRSARILDLGCGIGFWCEYFDTLGYQNVTGADLSSASLDLARARLKGSARVQFRQENAENLSFSQNHFDHVNCQGVIHHTPDTQQALNEIVRVTKPGGTVSVSVYYSNWLVRAYPVLRSILSAVFQLFGTKTGRGRDFSAPKNREDLVRLYDGIDNPIGKSYSRHDFISMCDRAGLEPLEIRYFFFPFRFLSFRFPRPLKRMLVLCFPFMIVANCRKKP